MVGRMYFLDWGVEGLTWPTEILCFDFHTLGSCTKNCCLLPGGMSPVAMYLSDSIIVCQNKNARNTIIKFSFEKRTASIVDVAVVSG